MDSRRISPKPSIASSSHTDSCRPCHRGHPCRRFLHQICPCSRCRSCSRRCLHHGSQPQSEIRSSDMPSLRPAIPPWQLCRPKSYLPRLPPPQPHRRSPQNHRVACRHPPSRRSPIRNPSLLPSLAQPKGGHPVHQPRPKSCCHRQRAAERLLPPHARPEGCRHQHAAGRLPPRTVRPRSCPPQASTCAAGTLLPHIARPKGCCTAVVPSTAPTATDPSPPRPRRPTHHPPLHTHSRTCQLPPTASPPRRRPPAATLGRKVAAARPGTESLASPLAEEGDAAAGDARRKAIAPTSRRAHAPHPLPPIPPPADTTTCRMPPPTDTAARSRPLPPNPSLPYRAPRDGNDGSGTLTDGYRGSHGGGARRALCFPPPTRPIRALRRKAKAPAPGVDCRGLPATIRDRRGRKTADGGCAHYSLVRHSDCVFRCQLVFAHVPVTVTQ